MSIATYVLGIVASLASLAVIVQMLRRRRLRERHAIWWLAAGALALVTSIFPTILTAIAGAIGIEAPINLAFFVSIAILALVCVQHSAELTSLEEKSRSLAEAIAMLELRMQDVDGSRDAQER